jgi:hypothetical protein
MPTDDYVGQVFHDVEHDDFFKVFPADDPAEPNVLETYAADTLEAAAEATSPDGGWVEADKLRQRIEDGTVHPTQ